MNLNVLLNTWLSQINLLVSLSLDHHPCRLLCSIWLVCRQTQRIQVIVWNVDLLVSFAILLEVALLVVFYLLDQVIDRLHQFLLDLINLIIFSEFRIVPLLGDIVNLLSFLKHFLETQCFDFQSLNVFFNLLNFFYCFLLIEVWGILRDCQIYFRNNFLPRQTLIL